MALRLTIRWQSPAYEAATVDPAVAEWPPEPVRPFCGMVAVARDEADREALRWLERQGAPDVWCSDAAASGVPRGAYVVTNAVAPGGGHQRYPARQAGRDPRRWARAFPARPVAHFLWPEAQAPREIVDALKRLAARVPYVGRATSPALVELVEGPVPERECDGLRGYQPVDPGSDRVWSVVLRAPYEGYVDHLQTAHDQGRPAYDVARSMPYAAMPTAATAVDQDTAVPGPFADLAVIGLPAGVTLDGRHTVRVTGALRNAVRARCQRDLASVHGHHVGDVDQCAFLAIPDVGHAHADGHLLGVAVALPRGLAPDDRAVVLRALLGDRSDPDASPMRWLTVARVGRLPLHEGTAGRRGLRAERWTAPARAWASVLPVVVDRYPKPRGALERSIVESCELAGYPPPSGVEVLAASVVAGGVGLRPHETLRRRGETLRPYRHVVLHFPAPVSGPVVVGSMRHYGLGLCLPWDREASER